MPSPQETNSGGAISSRFSAKVKRVPKPPASVEDLDRPPTLSQAKLEGDTVGKKARVTVVQKMASRPID